MHLVCLGVVKRLIWMKGPLINSCTLASSTLKRMSDSLVSSKSYMPREFNRKCRPLSKVESWRATEYRHWAICTNISCFFSVSIFCLSCEYFYEEYTDYASDLLNMFVKQFSQYYGEDKVVYSVHNLINLPVRKLGPLDRCSCFPFESFLFKLKCLIRRPNLLLQ